MTANANKVMPHGWNAAKQFPWVRMGWADFGPTAVINNRLKAVWGINNPRCQNTLSRPVKINELRIAAVGALKDELTGPPTNILLPALAMKFGKTGKAYVDEWIPVEAHNHNEQLQVFGVNGLATDSTTFRLPTPYFLQRGAILGMDFRLRPAWYGGPLGVLAGRAVAHGYDENGRAGVISSNMGYAPVGGVPVPHFTFSNSPGPVSGIQPRDMHITHITLSAIGAQFTDLNSEVDFSMYVEARFYPNTGPIWVPSEDGWISLLGLAAAPAFPVVSIPMVRPMILDTNEDCWIEFLLTATPNLDQNYGLKVMVWAVGTQEGGGSYS